MKFHNSVSSNDHMKLPTIYNNIQLANYQTSVYIPQYYKLSQIKQIVLICVMNKYFCFVILLVIFQNKVLSASTTAFN